MITLSKIAVSVNITAAVPSIGFVTHQWRIKNA
jgi:hypothetical protein